jgi:hypothetical protein
VCLGLRGSVVKCVHAAIRAALDASVAVLDPFALIHRFTVSLRCQESVWRILIFEALVKDYVILV